MCRHSSFRMHIVCSKLLNLVSKILETLQFSKLLNLFSIHISCEAIYIDERVAKIVDFCAISYIHTLRRFVCSSCATRNFYCGHCLCIVESLPIFIGKISMRESWIFHEI
jgi:hypothetical protein